MLEEEFKADNLNIKNEKSGSENQVDKFSQTTKLLDKELKDKKENISKVLEEWNLKEIFENLLSSEDGELCIMSLLECENNEEEIKKIILANLPEWYAYNVSTGNIVETQVNEPNTNFTWATTTDKKWETAAQDKETAAQKWVDTVQIEETAAQDKETAENRIQIVRETENRLLDYRTQLLAWHDDVKGKTEEKAKLAQQQLPQETRNQLKEKGYDDDDINNYILLRVTANEVKKDSSFDKNAVAEFEKSVNKLSTLDVILKSLDNACNIPDTSLNSFSPDNIGQTRTEMFNEDSWIWNESLKIARDNNMASHEKDYNEMFPEKMWEEDIMKKYWSFLEWQLKQFLENYVNNTGDLKNKIEEIKNNENPTEEEKKILEFYYYMLDELEKKRKETEEQTKNLMEEMCIISQIKWMYMCIWQEEWKDFNLNKAKEIESKDWVLTLKWHIDWVNFSVSHDTINPNQRLKIKSKLWVNAEDKNTFEIWKDESYVDSPFILPRQDEIFKVISEVVKSNDLSKSSDLSKYLEGLQNNIVWRMDEVYKDAELAHHYVTNKVKWEKIVDNSLALIQWIKPNMQDLTKPINQSSNPKLHSFMKMIKFNVENSTTEEKNKLNKCLSKIPEIVDAYKATGWTQNFAELKYPLIIENYLKNQTWLENWNEDSKLWLVFDLFSYYNQNSKDTRANVESSDWAPSKMIIEDLYRDLFEFQSSQSLIATTRKNEETEKQDKQDADDELASIDWPPVPMAV